MKAIDAVIDKDPTEDLVINLAELRNRNLLAFKELQNFNNTGKWLNRHPLIVHHSIRFKYKELLNDKPGEFLAEYTNTANNVSRYSSFLNNDKRTDLQKEKDLKNLAKHKELEGIMREVLEERKK